MFGKKPKKDAVQTPPEKTRAEYTLEYVQIEINRLVKEIDSVHGNSFNEADTCNRLILPFFHAFGWDPYSTFWKSHFLEVAVCD